MPDMANDQLSSKSNDSLNERIAVAEPHTEKRLLSPVERISEILFGLIMALTFTCTISIAEAGRSEVKGMLIGAIGCNLAWGLVDAVMYILTNLAERGRGLAILNFVRNTSETEKAKEFIVNSLPRVVASALGSDGLETVRQRLLATPSPSSPVRLGFKDFKEAAAIFLLVFFSTFPVSIPFLFIKEAEPALRFSNAVAIVLMFACGWLLGRYGGYSKVKTGVIMTLIGVILVFITIALGG
jgi:VIT family